MILLSGVVIGRQSVRERETTREKIGILALPGRWRRARAGLLRWIKTVSVDAA